MVLALFLALHQIKYLASLQVLKLVPIELLALEQVSFEFWLVLELVPFLYTKLSYFDRIDQVSQTYSMFSICEPLDCHLVSIDTIDMFFQDILFIFQKDAYISMLFQ